MWRELSPFLQSVLAMGGSSHMQTKFTRPVLAEAPKQSSALVLHLSCSDPPWFSRASCLCRSAQSQLLQQAEAGLVSPPVPQSPHMEGVQNDCGNSPKLVTELGSQQWHTSD